MLNQNRSALATQLPPKKLIKIRIYQLEISQKAVSYQNQCWDFSHIAVEKFLLFLSKWIGYRIHKIHGGDKGELFVPSQSGKLTLLLQQQ